jgi:hypothetical protein
MLVKLVLLLLAMLPRHQCILVAVEVAVPDPPLVVVFNSSEVIGTVVVRHIIAIRVVVGIQTSLHHLVLTPVGHELDIQTI